MANKENQNDGICNGCGQIAHLETQLLRFVPENSHCSKGTNPTAK
jgi:hypothetical protein